MGWHFICVTVSHHLLDQNRGRIPHSLITSRANGVVLVLFLSIQSNSSSNVLVSSPMTSLQKHHPDSPPDKVAQSSF